MEKTVSTWEITARLQNATIQIVQVKQNTNKQNQTEKQANKQSKKPCTYYILNSFTELSSPSTIDKLYIVTNQGQF